ncbi:hypothetical protein BDF19DRAFT_469152 [Syncephalis fuscata]|nr:hypothetical protein BDF19DRAFT_469152 [Syncephalis fuscata]
MKFSTAIIAAAVLLVAVVSVEARPGFTKPPTNGAACVVGAAPVGNLECKDNGDGTGCWGWRYKSPQYVLA